MDLDESFVAEGLDSILKQSKHAHETLMNVGSVEPSLFIDVFS
jgi:hypothetical protein